MNLKSTEIASFYSLLGNYLPDLESISISLKNPQSRLIFELLENELPRWPKAHSELFLAITADEKETRAKNIIAWLGELNNFLDFGCGDGLVVKIASKIAKKAIGYDKVEGHWYAQQNCFLTVEWDTICKNAPYDTILLYDVLDHLQGDPRETLVLLTNLLSKSGKIFVHCHPWCSRFGAHCNKSFAHLVFTGDELESLGYNLIVTNKILHPARTYESWFRDVNLKIIYKNDFRGPVEDFFQREPFYSRICAHWKGSYQSELAQGKVFPRFQMEQEFIRYILEK